jgi:ankyrin repeat protein
VCAYVSGQQNGNVKVAKLLVEKGANPNHQNKEGQTPGHFANSYGFYDLLGWLFEPSGGAADDTVTNKYGLTPYDGIRPAITDG